MRLKALWFLLFLPFILLLALLMLILGEGE